MSDSKIDVSNLAFVLNVLDVFFLRKNHLVFLIC